MSRLPLEQFIKSVLPETALRQALFPADLAISVDSRTLQAGEIFVALSGANVDGHQFVAEAVNKGAAGLIIADSQQDILSTIDQKRLAKMLVLVVPKPLDALIQLASAWRARFTYPVVGITGSVGKTSTKELLAHIMNESGMPYIASLGNQNTLVGVCINLLRMRSEHQCAIFEVGINRRGEMAHVVRILQPTTGIITTIGHAHMEGLGTVGDIAAEKRMLFSLFKADNVGVIHGDQSLLAAVSYSHPVIKFGAKTTNQIQARKVRVSAQETTFILKLYGYKQSISLPSNHSGAVHNSLAAIAMAYHLNVPTQTILAAIAKPVVVEGRFEPRSLRIRPGIVINDCYNANPESMKASLLAFQKIQTPAQKIAVLGDMRELGQSAPFWHRQLGRFLRKVPSLQRVVLIGDMVVWMKKTVPINVVVDHVANWQEAHLLLENIVEKDAVILVKGSRSMGLNNLVDALSNVRGSDIL